LKKSAFTTDKLTGRLPGFGKKPFFFSGIPILISGFEFGAEIALLGESRTTSYKEKAMKPKAKPTKKGKTLGAKKLEKKVTLQYQPITGGHT